MASSSDGRNGPQDEPDQQRRHTQEKQEQEQQRDRGEEQSRTIDKQIDEATAKRATPASESAPACALAPTSAAPSTPASAVVAPEPAIVMTDNLSTIAPTAAATLTSNLSAASVAASAQPSTPPPLPPPAEKRVRENDPAAQPPNLEPAAQADPKDNSAIDEPMPDAPVDISTHATVNPGHETSQQPVGQTSQQQTSQQQRPAVSSAMASTTMDHFQPSTPFAADTMSNLDQHAYMMMALASLSRPPPAMSPPPTVTPSQVTLPAILDDGLNGLGTGAALRQAGPDKALESFARIEFADSVFQMTTYAVIIGRDQRALEQARRDEKRAEEHKRRVEENASKGLPPPSPIQQDRSKFSKSYVSEEGGMLGPESDSEGNGRPAKRRKTSTTGSSQNDIDESQENMISNRQYVSHTPGAAAVDLTSLRPSPYHVPFIGIHSPGPNIASKTKAISREHLKIAYNQEEGVFEAIPLHKNGFFCEDVHYKSDKLVLKCGVRLQIKDIDFRFIINGVERGCTGAEEFLEEEAAKRRQSHGGKEMSFDFEQSHGNGEIQDTSDELSELDASPPELSDFGEEMDGVEAEEAEADAEADAEEEVAEEAEAEGDTSKEEMAPAPDMETLLPQIPKKRGPGRPPKNGIMSKREQRLLKKQQQEMAKKTIPQAPPAEAPIKRKVGRPRKHPLPENPGELPEKRKYKPRKPKTEDGAEGSDAERRARERRERKARAKSPPLELRIEDYTPEQLQKPNKNYGVLIDETLTAAPEGLTLKQIYKRICIQYPWFYFHTETKGWESSVRHNLIGNEAFKKDETTNLWSRVPGVELDAGKKRKASSPDRVLAAHGYGPYSYPYNAAPHMHNPGAPGFPTSGQAPPAGYQVPGAPGQPGQSARPMQSHGTSASPTGQIGQSAVTRPPAPPHVPGYGPPPAPARAQLGAPQPSAYSSPYASRPPPGAHPPVKTEDAAPVSLPPPPHPAPSSALLPSAAATSQSAVALGAPPAGARSHPNPSQISQASAGPAARPSATPPAGVMPRPVIDPRLLAAVVGLKNGLVENLKKARNPKAEAIVMSALNRCIGLKKEATENDKMESICIKGIRQVIDGFNKNKSPMPGSSATADALPVIFEPKVLASLNGFKDVSIKALKARLGESKAEAVTLSAVDRVLGLADASIMPPPGEGEQAGNLEGVEQHLMKSIRQLLVGMNQKLQEPK